MNETVAIAGATGFVGQELLKATRGHRKLIALTRHLSGGRSETGVEHRQADFFSVESLTRALSDVHTAIYLIHSMMPTARLDQSRFEDTDLWLADSFGRAAAQAGVKRIIYLGGLVPEGGRLSVHLSSRKEVEDSLGASGVPVVTLRAGLILGAKGSSFQILYLLVKRLPWMLCPRWAWTQMQPISLGDVVRLLDFCVDANDLTSGAYDIGGLEIVTYRDLMLECARLLGLRRRFLQAPFFTPGLSTLWVCLVTGASRRLVSPLVRSMSHSMVVRHHALLQAFGRPLESTRQALASCIATATSSLRTETRKRRKDRHREHDVRSIQRLSVPEGWTAADIAQEYFVWVGSRIKPWIHVDRVQSGEWRFCIKVLSWSWTLLDLRRRSSPYPHELECFGIVGGLLRKDASLSSQDVGTFEFRVSKSAGYALVGLHGFQPRLPWGIYKLTQAIAHRFIMQHFRNWLAKQTSHPGVLK